MVTNESIPRGFSTVNTVLIQFLGHYQARGSAIKVLDCIFENLQQNYLIMSFALEN